MQTHYTERWERRNTKSVYKTGMQTVSYTRQGCKKCIQHRDANAQCRKMAEKEDKKCVPYICSTYHQVHGTDVGYTLFVCLLCHLSALCVCIPVLYTLFASLSCIHRLHPRLVCTFCVSSLPSFCIVCLHPCLVSVLFTA